MTAGRRMIRCRSAVYLGLSLLFAIGLFVNIPTAMAQYPASSQITKDGTAILVEDYATVPLSSQLREGTYPAKIDLMLQLSRVNAMRSEPANVASSATRFFVCDNNGVLYILDKKTRKFSPYIDFGKVFPKFINAPSLGPGLISIAFDPDYAKNGKFYTIHTEKPATAASAIPTNASMPGFKADGYQVTESVNVPVGEVTIESVLVEWIDTNIKNATFEGTAREVLREGYDFPFHHMDDLLFNPVARPGQPDYGNLYLGLGDGGSGDRPGPTHTIPQRLDVLQGKILRITPNATLHPTDQLSANGRYRIPSTGPNANPFVSVGGARPEIYAYGLRNPHRLAWDPKSNTLLANAIGNHSWESIVVITKGANYGWGDREGPEQTFIDDVNNGKTGGQLNPPVPFPAVDKIVVDRLQEPLTPVYPVVTYSHREGDAIGSGFVYRGKLMPQMVGKYIFTDMTTGRVFYTDLAEMLAAGGVRGKTAAIHEIQIMYKNPNSASEKTPVKRRMYDIVADEFARRGGTALENTAMPDAGPAVGGGRGATLAKRKIDPYGVPYGGGRADVRLSMGGDGEIYLLCKTDGMIRKLAAVETPPPDSRK